MIDKPLLIIGVMTGNSVDGVDVVLTAFHSDGKIRDLCSHFLPFDETIYSPIRTLQNAVANARGEMKEVVANFHWQFEGERFNFNDLQDFYIAKVAQAIKELIRKAKTMVDITQHYDIDSIDAIGLHGQTCDHSPPSRIGSFKPDAVYTVQVGNGQQLADLTGITVVYDFRSDDLMRGGEAAPLAPVHVQHLAEHAKLQGLYPITFCNAGNTGNIAHITHEIGNPGVTRTVGWDTGPFNHYPDLLMRTETKHPCDFDGKIGRTGKINLKLLEALFEGAVLLDKGDNYLLQAPPKSGDPNHYHLIPELRDTQIPFQDRLRTAEYFSAYIFVHSLSLTPVDLVLPVNFSIFGGGWMNPVILEHFKDLLKGDNERNSPVMVAHKEAFEEVRERLQQTGGEIIVDWSNAFGFDGKAMEARIFADMARCRLMGKPFSTPDTTGVQEPVVGGIIRFPHRDHRNATAAVRSVLEQYKSENMTLDNSELFDPRWSRGSAGWAKLAAKQK